MNNNVMPFYESLQPGDKMTLAIQKMKPTWLSQQTQGQGEQAAAPAAPAPPPSPAPSLMGPSRDALMGAMSGFNPEG